MENDEFGNIFDDFENILKKLAAQEPEPYIMCLPPLPIYGNDFLENYDKGSWVVVDYDGKIGIQSDDFYYDVTLMVTGDFGDTELKRKYAQSIADVLNVYLKNQNK